jgi:hypothetical protein
VHVSVEDDAVTKLETEYAPDLTVLRMKIDHQMRSLQLENGHSKNLKYGADRRVIDRRSVHHPPTMKVAVVGSGVSGIGAVWALNEYSEHEVHLFEANDYLGGHTNTVEFSPHRSDNGNSSTKSTNVDTGFIVLSFQVG